MATKRLQDRIALITGSSSGLGRAIATAFADEGANVCCVDLYPNLRSAVDASTGKADSIHNRIDTGQPTHELINDSSKEATAIFVRADCTKADDFEKAIGKCVQTFGRLDILVNNAGISVESQHENVMRIHDTTEEDFDKTMAINTRGVFLGCKYEKPTRSFSETYCDT
jgi:NAD(P)-dependent dehydrogenase (short-subunit alcohol dehydrogenase family)